MSLKVSTTNADFFVLGDPFRLSLVHWREPKDNIYQIVRSIKMIKNKIVLIYIAFIVLIYSACTFGTTDPDPIPQTKVLSINLYPDTVAVGDTVLIHCIIEDSLDIRFKFYWGFGSPIPVNGTIHGSKIRYKAKSTSDIPGVVEDVATVVRIDNGSMDSVSITKVFRIPIIN